MASRITAINAFRPKLVLGRTIKQKELVEYIAGRTGLNRGDIQLALSEFSESIVFFGKQGQGVKLDGLGTYLPSIDTKGVLSLEHRTDTQIKNVMNTKGAYQGDIINRDNIGKTSAELVTLWNTKHPEDKVV